MASKGMPHPLMTIMVLICHGGPGRCRILNSIKPLITTPMPQKIVTSNGTKLLDSIRVVTIMAWAKAKALSISSLPIHYNCQGL